MAGNSSSPRFEHLVEPVHAGGRLLAHALDLRGDRRPAVRVLGKGALERVDDDAPLLRVVVGGIGHGAGLLVLEALVDEEGGVATVVQDHVRALAPGELEQLLRAPPVVLEGLALPGVDRHAGRVVHGAVGADDDGGSSLVLGREDVAAHPAHVGAERGQRLDEHAGLDGHVQRPGDAGTGEGLAVTELGPQGHEPGHLDLGQLELLAAPGGEREVGDLEVLIRGGHGGFLHRGAPVGAHSSVVVGLGAAGTTLISPGADHRSAVSGPGRTSGPRALGSGPGRRRPARPGAG